MPYLLCFVEKQQKTQFCFLYTDNNTAQSSNCIDLVNDKRQLSPQRSGLARRTSNPEVVGSNPTGDVHFFLFCNSTLVQVYSGIQMTSYDINASSRCLMATNENKENTEIISFFYKSCAPFFHDSIAIPATQTHSVYNGNNCEHLRLPKVRVHIPIYSRTQQVWMASYTFQGNCCEKKLAERGFDPRTSGLWAQHASTAPLCYLQHGSATGQ